MWRILLVACLWLLDCPDSTGQDVLISRYTFTGNTTLPSFVHEAVFPRPISLAPIIPTDCPFCPFVLGHPSSGQAYGSYGWPDANTPDLSRYIEIPVKVTPGRTLDLVRLSFEGHRESLAADKWQIRYSKNNFSSPLASGLLEWPNKWSTVTIPLSSIQPLQNLSDSVTFRIYPFNAKEGPTKDKNTIWRIDSVRIYNAGQPLPVELTHFAVSPEGQDIQLKWATATELNSEYFGIEHALGGVVFQELDRVPAAGWSVALQSYQWMHRAAGPGQHYYRLRFVDRDGQEEYSPVQTTRIQGETSPPLQAWYGNEGLLHVNNLSTSGILEVWDLSGRLMCRVSTDNSASTLNLSAGLWPAGIYFLKHAEQYVQLVKP